MILDTGFSIFDAGPINRDMRFAPRFWILSRRRRGAGELGLFGFVLSNRSLFIVSAAGGFFGISLCSYCTYVYIAHFDIGFVLQN